ncbi:MAG: hypothetical protein IJC92_05205 [Bacteroidaceae bacterium]|nr:hypothetical protein [Bacteroidaceae bacterium]
MKKTIFISLLLALFAGAAMAQNHVSVNAEIDSCQRFIGEQARIKLKVGVDANKRALLPQFDKEIMEGVEIVEKLPNDTQILNDGKRLLITEEYVVTSFDSALYAIPPFEVLVDGEPFYSEELALAVYMVPVDTTNLEQFFPPKDIWAVELTWDDYKGSVGYSLLFILLAAILAWVTIRYINNKPIIRIVKLKPKLPAHVVALNEMERIKSDTGWRTAGSSKEYYTAITDALREYMNERFAFNATEMTTAEIINELLKIKDKESLRDLRDILETADLVKFAKFNPPMNENDRNLLNAIEFVDSTKLADSEIQQQPTEKKVVNERSVREKRLLLLAVVLLSLATATVLALLISELYYLLS